MCYPARQHKQAKQAFRLPFRSEPANEDRHEGDSQGHAKHHMSKMPYRYSPKIAKHNARLGKLIKAGIIKPMSKQQMRDMLEHAAHEPMAYTTGDMVFDAKPMRSKA